MLIEILTIIASIIGLITILLFYGYYHFKRKFLKQLREYPNYSPTIEGENKIQFEYSQMDDENLERLRNEFKLDDIVNNGSEVEKIIRLMKWTHNLTTHSRNPTRPKEISSLGILKEVQEEGKEINCWMYSTVLNDVYLSMGFKSRMVHLNSPKKLPGESHFANSVYSQKLNKWLYMDADFGAYLTEKDGTILSPMEIREKLVNNEKIYLNKGSGPNTKRLSRLARFLGRKTYLTYLSKNFFRISCPISSEFGYESNPSGRIYVELVPKGYCDEKLTKPHVTERNNTIIYTTDTDIFWHE